jgi:hypothetical protein
MFLIDDNNVPLCLDCNTKLQQMVAAQNAEHERQLNYLSDEMDAIVGIGPIGPRYPERPQPVILQGGTFNNIKVTDSTIGMINTGQLHQVDTAISVIGQQGDPQLAETLKALTDLIVAADGLGDEGKKEAIEILSVLGSEATLPVEQRRNSIAKPLLERLREVVGDAANIATITQAMIVIIAGAFG